MKHTYHTPPPHTPRLQVACKGENSDILTELLYLCCFESGSSGIGPCCAYNSLLNFV